jgi:hypothetical protein
MVLHVPLCSEGDSAFLEAGVRTVIIVDQHVCLEVLLLAEGLLTAFDGASKRLSTVDGLHVTLVLILPVEADITLLTVVALFLVFLYFEENLLHHLLVMLLFDD